MLLALGRARILIPFAVVVSNDFNVCSAFLSVPDVAAVVGAVPEGGFTAIMFHQKSLNFLA